MFPSFRMKPIDWAKKLRVRLLELSRFGIPLVKPEEDLASPREILQENLRRLELNAVDIKLLSAPVSNKIDAYTPAIASKMPYFVALVAFLGARAIMVKMALGALRARSPVRLPFCVGAEFLIYQFVGQLNSLIERPGSGRLDVPINVVRKSTDVLVNLFGFIGNKFGTYQESLPSVLDVYAVAVSSVPGDGSRMHTHDHDGSEAPDESPDSILSSKPKPLEKHRPPPSPSILFPGESSYPP
ncbi:hypothetical protein Tco_0783079 [Tanacetum coccineum]